MRIISHVKYLDPFGLEYKDKVGRLTEALTDDKCRAEAVEVIRGLIDKIALTPVELVGKATMAVDLHGSLAAMLSLAANTKKPPLGDGFSEESTKLVAGAGFEPFPARFHPTRWRSPVG